MRYEFKVTGIDCPMCALGLSQQLRLVKDFQSVNFNIFTHHLVIYTWLDNDEVRLILEKMKNTFHGTICFNQHKTGVSETGNS